MKTINNKIYITNFNTFSLKSFFLTAMMAVLFSACEKNVLPEEGSIPDLTPPSASFAFTPSDADYLQITFSNESGSATDYTWDFGDGMTSTEKNPVHTYSAAGDYTVSLTSSDKLNVSSTTTRTIEIKEPVNDFVPVILNPGFDIEGDDSYRDHWKNGDLGGVLQITSDPVHDGPKAAKFPSAGDRIAYQLITVQANKDYIVSFYYTMKTSPEGTMTVAILAGDVTDPDKVADATIDSVTLTDQSDSGTYVLDSVSFNSGDNTEVAILVTNVGVECRIDSFTIVED
ncbi:MAG: PKD domain-containing protein [Chitinophagales bacterium]